MSSRLADFSQAESAGVSGAADSLPGEDLYCPHCGYNLREIPERQCPECGFGYDHRGVRSVSVAEAVERDRACRHVICLATFSIAILLAPLIDPASQGSLMTLAIAFAGLVVAVAVARRLGDPTPLGSGFGPIPMFLLLPLLLISSAVAAFSPAVALITGTAIAVRGWWIFQRIPGMAPFSEKNLGENDRRFLHRRYIQALVLLTISSIFVVSAWMQ